MENGLGKEDSEVWGVWPRHFLVCTSTHSAPFFTLYLASLRLEPAPRVWPYIQGGESFDSVVLLGGCSSSTTSSGNAMVPGCQAQRLIRSFGLVPGNLKSQCSPSGKIARLE